MGNFNASYFHDKLNNYKILKKIWFLFNTPLKRSTPSYTQDKKISVLHPVKNSPMYHNVCMFQLEDVIVAKIVL